VSALFVTGTDTACGKTQVGCALARGLRAAGLRVRALKPVETGCSERGGALVPADALALAAAADDASELDALCPYRLRLAAAPEVAARAEGVQIDLGRIERALARARRGAGAVIVEGAGGLLVPIRADLDMAGLALRLGLPLVVVARARLGTINHTLLTLEAALARGLAVLGVAISHTCADLDEAERCNLEALREQLARRAIPCLGELAHGAELLAPEPAPRALLDALGAT
jgi:dethiobiotin synthetase